MKNFTAKTAGQIMDGENVDYIIDVLNTAIGVAANNGSSYYYHDLKHETGRWYVKDAQSLTRLRQPQFIQKVLYNLRATGFNADYINEGQKEYILIWWRGDKPII